MRCERARVGSAQGLASSGVSLFAHSGRVLDSDAAGLALGSGGESEGSEGSGGESEGSEGSSDGDGSDAEEGEGDGSGGDSDVEMASGGSGSGSDRDDDGEGGSGVPPERRHLIDEEAVTDETGRVRRRAVFSDGGDVRHGGGGGADAAGGGGAGARWKRGLAEKAEAAFAQRRAENMDLVALVCVARGRGRGC